jgi:hypothetical protein
MRLHGIGDFAQREPNAIRRGAAGRTDGSAYTSLGRRSKITVTESKRIRLSTRGSLVHRSDNRKAALWLQRPQADMEGASRSAMPTQIISIDSRRRKKGVSTPSWTVSGAVPCPRCRRPIPASFTTCPECGVHFEGWAEDFTDAPPSFFRTCGARYILLAVSALLLLSMLLALLGRC